jgi:predicted secreted hydrolase
MRENRTRADIQRNTLVARTNSLSPQINLRADIFRGISSTSSWQLKGGISFKGLTYKLIASPNTGRVWLDRNLGATKVADSSTDIPAYGDYFPRKLDKAVAIFLILVLSGRRVVSAANSPSVGTLKSAGQMSLLLLNGTSRYTGRVWLDRNLGAKQVATSGHDTDSYGSLYQWGRGKDDHEDRI